MSWPSRGAWASSGSSSTIEDPPFCGSRRAVLPAVVYFRDRVIRRPYRVRLPRNGAEPSAVSRPHTPRTPMAKGLQADGVERRGARRSSGVAVSWRAAGAACLWLLLAALIVLPSFEIVPASLP